MVVQRLAAGASRYRPLVVGPPVRGEAYPGIDFLPAGRPRFLPLSVTQAYAVGLVRVLRRLPPGLIEVHNKPDVAMWLARWFPARPVLLFLHNDPRSMRGARSPAARQALLARLAKVITVSEYLRGAVLDGVAPPLPERAPVVIHNALDFAAVPAGRAREKLILFAGRVVPDKAPDVFITACAQVLPLLPGWRAEIIGTDGFSTEATESGFIRRLRPLAAAACIAMPGYRPQAEVLEAMARAAIVVVPSRWAEPFGLTALEAMACGAALITSGRGGLSEIAGEAGVTINPDRPDTLAAALLSLAADEPLRARLAAVGLERARQHFNAVDAITRLDAIRDEVTA
jgi:glycosyltransferase involved in cell wall biosynthesis